MVGTDVESDTLFLSTKINKIRWHPAPFLQEEGNTRGLFAVGSYDEVVNKVSIYSLNFSGNNPPETTKLCSQTIKGGAADIKFVLDESNQASLLLASTFNGELVAYNAIDLEEIGKLFPEKQGQGVYPDLATIGAIKLHNGALTSMDISNHKEVVTAGSDGDVNVVDMGESIKVLRKIEGDGMPINCIRYMSSCVAIASNQIKLLDIKSNSQIKIRSEKGTPFQSIAPHPHQGNFLCSGSCDGTVNVWDRRASTLPISSQNIHSDNVWEIQFLPGQHDIVSSVSSSLLSLINFNPSQSLTTDFGAKVRHSLSSSLSSSSSSSSSSLSSYSIPFTYGLNSCDSHEGSGLVIGGGDSGNVILAKLNIQNISGNNIRGGMKKNMYIQ